MMNNAPQRPEARKGSLSAVAIIPARLGSTRLPRKMLLRETGQYLFEHTVRNLQTTGVVDKVLLATDSDEIVRAAEGLDIDVVMTDAAHTSGTDRVHEAYGQLTGRCQESFDVILNVQGDEPELSEGDLQRLISEFEHFNVDFATLWVPVEDPLEALSASTVKVVLDTHGDALYFSRSPIPNTEHGRGAKAPLKRHVGVYAFRPDALARFCALPPGKLERAESLEQLRWLEAGERLRVVEAKRAPRGIDTREDYAAFVARQAGQG